MRRSSLFLSLSLSLSLSLCVAHVYRLAQALGWRSTMYALSAITWLSLIAFQLMVSDAPMASGGRLPLSVEEAALYLAEGMLVEDAVSAKKRPGSAADAVKSTGASGSSVRVLFTNKGTWALILSHTMFNLGRFTYEQEMPKCVSF